MRIAIVVPRFSEGVIVGGAENHAYQLGVHLQREGHDIEVLTTCALDHHAWVNELPPGPDRVGSLAVRRFQVDERDLGVHGELERALQNGFRLSLEEELLWLRHGVSSAAMEGDLAARGDRYDAILAMPYLFGTTYFAAAARPERTVLIPCLHDEPYAHCAFVGEMLRSVRGVMFNAHAEARLGLRLAGDIDRWAVVGVGFEPSPTPDVDRVRRRYGLRWPSLLYVGRREGGKNTPVLVDYFMRYTHRRRTDLRLALVGSGDPVPAHDRIVDLGKLGERELAAVYAASTVFCQPSINESLSIVLMEAWLAGRPAIVHARCDVTREHCERANGGLWFESYAEFEEIMDRLLADPALRDALGANGRAYALREYGWAPVLERFHRAMGEWVGEPSPVR